MSVVNIGGKIYTGNSITIRNGVVWIDGVIQNEACQSAVNNILEIKIEGNLNKLECDGSATVTGNCGSVSCGGSFDSNGDISGNVSAGGSVKCGKVHGNIMAGGSVRHG